MFSDVLARFPESVHDSRIWKISDAGMYVEDTFSMGEHILGDSGYILRPYLLTPYYCTNVWTVETKISLSSWKKSG